MLFETSSLAMFGITSADIVGWVVFGGIGIIACAWGKMKGYWQPWVLGIALGVFPYFIPNGILLWIVGIVLTALLPFAKN